MEKERNLLNKLTDLQTVSLSKKLAHVLSCIFLLVFSLKAISFYYFFIFKPFNHS